jgi:hypothetical protein
MNDKIDAKKMKKMLVSISSIEHSAYLLHQFSSLVWSHMSKEKIKKQKHNAVRFDGLYN